MDSGPLSCQIKADLSNTTAKFTISKVHASYPKLLLHCIPETVHTDSELSVTQVYVIII